MDCEKSLSLLSDYRDGALDGEHRDLVARHLDGCPPCKCVFTDIDTIVVTARTIAGEDGVSYPDEETFWQRITVTRTALN
ncbi:MAG: zf-HC2 domain-containing protein [Acidobacteriota bacterium]|nr:zf-HC2 domain-containing protein [Acidobacteriota bacterium]